jgi:CMP/dCMP kinase
VIVAIDGPAGCGKSTIARMISAGLGFLYINSGNIYRAIAFDSAMKEISISDTEALIRAARTVSLNLDAVGGIWMSGKKLTSELRSSKVDAIVAQISAVPEIRDVVNAIVRRVAQGKDCIVEGRDMTTVVFPRAEAKFYLDASVQKRAKRRFDENSSGLPFEKILENIRMRDEIDKTKSVGALKIAPDAEYLDTSDLTIGQVYEKVYSKILHLREAHGE